MNVDVHKRRNDGVFKTSIKSSVEVWRNQLRNQYKRTCGYLWFVNVTMVSCGTKIRIGSVEMAICNEDVQRVGVQIRR